MIIKPNISIFSYNTKWKKTSTSQGTEEVVYELEKTKRKISYRVDEKGLQVTNGGTGCNNPLSALVELADCTQVTGKTDIVQQFVQKFGFFSSEDTIFVTLDELTRIATHYRLLLNILRAYYRDDESYVELFQNCVSYHMLHSVGSYNYNIMPSVDQTDGSFYHADLGFVTVDFDSETLERIKQENRVSEKHWLTEALIDSAISDYRKAAEDDAVWESDEETEVRTPDILLLMRRIIHSVPYYIEDKNIYFMDDSDIDRELKKFRIPLTQVAEHIISESLGNTKIEVLFDVPKGACRISIDDLQTLMLFSLIQLRHKDYGYYPCSNPRCRRYVLRRHPESTDINILNPRLQNHFCSAKCARQQAQRNYQLRNK